MHHHQNEAHCINEHIPLSTPEPDNLLGRFFRLAIINILSNLLVPLAGLISIAFLGHLMEIRHPRWRHSIYCSV
jgi:MATE family multidrug resistance protein